MTTELKDLIIENYTLTNLKRKRLHKEMIDSGYINRKFIYLYTLIYPNGTKSQSWLPASNINDFLH